MRLRYLLWTGLALILGGCCSTAVSDSAGGESGSLARFAVKGDYLYTVNAGQMNLFEISDAANPQSISRVRLPWDVETIFVYDSYLYIGAMNGMYIYDTSVPTQPTQITEFTHAQSCDPVVVQDDVAYVTLNSASSCAWDNGINRLEIVDVQNPYAPKLIQTMDMWAPLGLGIDGKTLFICDGDDGLKLFDVNKTQNENNETAVALTAISTYSAIECTDLIPYEGHLVVSDTTSIRQFDYSQFPMTELGKVE